MKRIFYSALAALTLSACSVGTPGMSVGVGLGTRVGSHLGLGTSLNIPIGFDRTETGKKPGNYGGLNIAEAQIVTYFDAQGNTSDNAVKGGFYRQLLSKRNNEYVVQDFYSDNGQKRTDPYTLAREQLLRLRAVPANGSLVTYAYNGSVMQQQLYQNGKLVSAKY